MQRAIADLNAMLKKNKITFDGQWAPSKEEVEDRPLEEERGRTTATNPTSTLASILGSFSTTHTTIPRLVSP